MKVSGQLHAPAALHRERAASIHWTGGWVEGAEPVWTRWWTEKFPAPAGNLSRPASSLVAIPTELSRLFPCLRLDMAVRFKSLTEVKSTTGEYVHIQRSVWSLTALPLGSWVRIPLGAWMYVHVFNLLCCPAYVEDLRWADTPHPSTDYHGNV
jgi:hypothetical protein